MLGDLEFMAQLHLPLIGPFFYLLEKKDLLLQRLIQILLVLMFCRDFMFVMRDNAGYEKADDPMESVGQAQRTYDVFDDGLINAKIIPLTVHFISIIFDSL